MTGCLKVLLRGVYAAKPVLVKIIPVELLRKWKNKMAAANLKKAAQRRIPYQAGHYPRGVNLIGNIRLEAGLGQSCRLVASTLEQSGIPLDIYQYAPPGADNIGDHSWDSRISSQLHYDINLIHINPTEMADAFSLIDPSVLDERYNIGFWLWELEDIPDTWTTVISCVDEIWSPSEFVCRAIRRKTTLPVKCMPYYVEADIHKEYQRQDFGLPKDRFLFLMMYDSYSCTERKNPFAVLHAFRAAFDKENADVGLVIKISHPAKEDEERIAGILAGYQNLYLIRDMMDRSAVNSLIKCVDVVVSLHRAEGFGLVLAEAMLLGTPVIATNWSANTEFMDLNTACMVDYRLVTIEKEIPPFPAGGRWADPDIGQAAEYMKRLYSDREFYEKLSVRAKAHVKNILSMERAKKVMTDRLEEIYQEQKSST